MLKYYSKSPRGAKEGITNSFKVFIYLGDADLLVLGGLRGFGGFLGRYPRPEAQDGNPPPTEENCRGL